MFRSCPENLKCNLVFIKERQKHLTHHKFRAGIKEVIRVMAR
jgi:hypothetical protein